MNEEMSELFMNSIEEMKRADHLLYVSLKYTRTVEVLLSIVQRLINAYDWMWDAILKTAEEDERIFEMPTAPVAKVEQIRKLYPDRSDLHEYIDFYLILRSINRASGVARKNEYRRHVTLTASIDNGARVDVTIDIIGEYFHRTQAFLDLIKHSILGNENE